MSIVTAAILFVIGLLLVVTFAEKLVEGVVGTSLGFGISTFLVSVIFLGFDPENLAVGAVGSFEGVAGIALGSILGAAMVAVALAFGITALVVPLEFRQVPRRVLIAPVAALVLLGVLAVDGILSRIDGAVLILAFAASVYYLIWLSQRGLDVQPTGEVAETIEEAEEISRWKAAGLLVLSLVAVILGSEMIVTSSETILAEIGLSDTLFGMTMLAFLISIEEIARELPAALKGRAEITFGNVVGSILAFFLFNAGIIALVRPVPVGDQTLLFYLPVAGATILTVSGFMLARRVPRWAGGILIILYLGFVVGGFLV